MTTNLKENSKEANNIFLYSDKTDLVICEACFTEYVSIENINKYEAVNLKELETVPTCELCQGVL
tara:strand:- start:657 stop:851 length:195 start_codon:yes stop_codon:yes gene_type:complete